MSTTRPKRRTPRVREIGEIVEVLRQYGKRRDDVLPYFAPKDREIAGAEYDRQFAAEPTAPPGAMVH